MRPQIVVFGLLQAAMLVACNDRLPEQTRSEPARDHSEVGVAGKTAAAPRPASKPVSSEEQAAAQAPWQWSSASNFDVISRMIIRTGQASIEVDSLEPSMMLLRQIVQRTGGFVADASIQSGRNQIRSATLQVKVPAARFDDLTQALQPLGKLQFVNVSAEDVSEEFVDLTARVANGHRLEDRLVELLRTRTGKLSDVLSVERELARVREEIERMEGRLRFLKTSAQLSTLSVNLYEPAPLVASHPGRSVIGEAFKSAWRNFVGVLAAAIASLGFVVPIVILGWGAWLLGKRYRRKAAAAPGLSKA
jgi:hypothetical protein